MAYCKKCGNWLQDNARFCSVCGEPMTAQPQQPQQPQYQQPQYQQPQYQPPKQNYPNTWSLPKSSGQPVPQYPRSQELFPNQAPQQPVVAAPVSPAKPPKKNKKTLLILLICLGVLLAGIIGVGCWLIFGGNGGSGSSDDSVLGRYEIISCREDGEELETNDEWILLAKNGKATISLDDETFSAKWELDGEDLTIIQDGDEYTGTLEDDILTLDLDGVIYTFGKDGARPQEEAPAVEAPATEAPVEAPPAPEPAAPAAPVPAETEGPSAGAGNDITWWEGDWYGWWIIYEGKGEWVEAEDVAFDVCGRISVDPGTGTGHVSLWDEDEGSNQYRWEVDVAFTEGSDDRGIMCSTDGTFRGAMPYGDWVVDPNEYPYSDFENFICIQGTYSEGANSGYTYYIFLRPWGTRWEDIRNGDMSQMPYTDMMPIHYDTWYLPLISAGKSMPSSIDD